MNAGGWEQLGLVLGGGGTVVAAWYGGALMLVRHLDRRDARRSERQDASAPVAVTAPGTATTDPNAALPRVPVARGAIYAPPGGWITSMVVAATDPADACALPVEHTDEPVRGWKVAGVAWCDGRWSFKSMRDHAPYDADAMARCMRRESVAQRPSDRHAVPDARCTCGFYATRDDAWLRAWEFTSPRWILRVELFGTVIDCEDGYRASRQRVLDVIPPSRCYACGVRTDTVAFDLDAGVPRPGRIAKHVDVRAYCDAHGGTQWTRVPINDAIAALGVARHYEIER